MIPCMWNLEQVKIVNCDRKQNQWLPGNRGKWGRGTAKGHWEFVVKEGFTCSFWWLSHSIHICQNIHFKLLRVTV